MEADTRVSLSAASAEVASRLGESTVLVHSRSGAGSGVVWRSDGLIVTNRHVLGGERSRVVFPDGTERDARVSRLHPRHDLATLQVRAARLRPVEIGNSARLRVGQLVFAAGNPMGLRGTVTAGIIVGAGQAAGVGGAAYGDLVQSDVALAPGSSGGPLADAGGRVVGINTLISGAGLSLAIPSNTVRDWLSPEQGVPYLGLKVAPVLVGSGERGLVALEVEEGSPADRVGMLQGDVVIEVAGQAVGGQEMSALLRRLSPGSPVVLTALRGGSRRDFVTVPALRAAA